MKKSLLLFVFSLALFSACMPTPTPEPATVSSPAELISFVEEYYQLINAAQSRSDFSEPWDMLSNQGQCNSRDYCELNNFQDRWSEWKVAYRLYDCGSNRLLVEETRYLRDGSSTVTPVASQYWKYHLDKVDDVLMIDEIALKQGVDAECVLVADHSANP